MQNFKILGIPTTKGELIKLIETYPDDTSFGFRNMPLLELVETTHDDVTYLSFQYPADDDILLKETMSPEIKEIVMSSPALKELSELYPPNRHGEVPLKIIMCCTVKSDLPIFTMENPDMIAFKGQEYYVWCNSHGAMSAILPNGKRLGIKPSECEIIEWH